MEGDDLPRDHQLLPARLGIGGAFSAGQESNISTKKNIFSSWVVDMATEQALSVTTRRGQLAKWAAWLGAVIGLWALVSPFVLSGAIDSGPPFVSTVVVGVLVLVLSAFAAYTIRVGAETAANTPAEWGGWIAALVGLWLLVSPFVLSGSFTDGTAMGSTVVAGLVVAILAAYAGYDLHTAG